MCAKSKLRSILCSDRKQHLQCALRLCQNLFKYRLYLKVIHLNPPVRMNFVCIKINILILIILIFTTIQSGLKTVMRFNSTLTVLFRSNTFSASILCAMRKYSRFYDS